MKTVIEFIRETPPEELKDLAECLVGFMMLAGIIYFGLMIGYAAGLN